MRLSSEDVDGDVLHAFTAADGIACISVSGADAALIAAAPALLSALQAITALYSHDDGCKKLGEYRNAQSAIALALNTSP